MPGRRRRFSLVTRRFRREAAELEVPEFDEPALGLQTEIAPRHRALLPLRRHGAVNPQGDVLALAGDLIGVPLAGFLAALRHLVVDPYPLELAVHQGVAEEVADV